jgi:multiple antibiotic resistance protein
MDAFLLCLIPILVALDPPGILPFYLQIRAAFSASSPYTLLSQALSTALAVALVFLFGGQAFFTYLGITSSDFMIAGGLILLVIALRDILSASKNTAIVAVSGAVPLGVPLLAGPALLSTTVLLHNRYGLWPTFFALLAGFAITAVVFLAAEPLFKMLKESGVHTISKIAALILAALAVMMIRTGIGQYLTNL